MTKMLMVGMPLAEVIRASTSTPAKAIGYADKIGTLRVGLEADVAVLEIRRTDFGMSNRHSSLSILAYVSRDCCRRAATRRHDSTVRHHSQASTTSLWLAAICVRSRGLPGAAAKMFTAAYLSRLLEGWTGGENDHTRTGWTISKPQKHRAPSSFLEHSSVS
jgi:hypothetical protein